MTTRDDIAAGLDSMGVPADESQLDSLRRHIESVYLTNKELNLTAIDEAQAAAFHVLDCAVAAPFLNDAPPGEFADLGSGAGFPGVTLAILTGRTVSLVESVRKKAAFLERVVAELCLKATVQPIRAEELAQTRPGAYAAVTARALSALPSLVELAAPLLSDGGRLICLKGRPGPDEIERGDRVAALVGMRRLGMLECSVPGVDGARVIVLYEKAGTARITLPRRNGMAQRQPLA